MKQSTGKGAKSDLKPTLLIDFCNIRELELESLVELYEKHEIGRLSEDPCDEYGPWTLVCKTRFDEGRFYFLEENDFTVGIHEMNPDSFILPSQPEFESLWTKLRSSQKYYQTSLDRCISNGRLEISFAREVLRVFERVQIRAREDDGKKWQPDILIDPSRYEVPGIITNGMPSLSPAKIETYIDFQIANIVFQRRGDEVFPYIKKCNLCERYYITKTLRSDQRFCSGRCKSRNKWSRDEWSNYMREYRKKQREQKDKEQRMKIEKEITRRMNVADMTREEVIEQMEADAEL